MDMQHLDDNFAKIARLFLQYKEGSSHENNDLAMFGLSQKIVVEFIKAINASCISDAMKSYPDAVVEKVRYCLKKYPDKKTGRIL